MTICWHVDNLKISHVDHRQVTKMIKWLERRYGKMQVSRGKKHNYLGMVLDYTSPGEVKIDMVTSRILLRVSLS